MGDSKGLFKIISFSSRFSKKGRGREEDDIEWGDVVEGWDPKEMFQSDVITLGNKNSSIKAWFLSGLSVFGFLLVEICNIFCKQKHFIIICYWFCCCCGISWFCYVGLQCRAGLVRRLPSYVHNSFAVYQLWVLLQICLCFSTLILFQLK